MLVIFKKHIFNTLFDSEKKIFLLIAILFNLN